MSALGSSPEVPAIPTFQQVFAAESVYVYNTLRRLGVRYDDLPDMTQEVFLTVASILEDYDPERPMRPWLFGIAYRVAMRHLDRAYHRRELTIEPPERAAEAPNPEALLGQEQTRARVHEALMQIEPNQRAILLLTHREGLTVPEASKVLDIPLNTGYSRLGRAREAFAAAARRLGLKGEAL